MLKTMVRPVIKKQKQKAKKRKGNQPNPGTGRLGLGGGRAGATNRRLQYVEEDEYIEDIFGSVGFATTQYPINPGQVSTFPWANKVAQLYECYEFEYLEFYYKRLVSEFSTNGQAGVMIMSCDYDSADAAPTTKQQVEDNEDKAQGMPCTDTVRLPIDVSRLRKDDNKYVRVGAQPANTDIRVYDAGNLYVSTQGNTNATVIGELHVRYRIKFSKPVLEQSSLVGGAVHFSSITATTANNFNGAVLQSGGTPLLADITLGTNTIIFPAGIPGNYLVQLLVSGATSASANSFLSGGTAVNLFTSSGARNAASVGSSLAGTTVFAAMSSASRAIATGGDTLTWNPSTIVGTGSMDLFIISLPSTVLTEPEPVRLEDRIMRLERLLLAAGKSLPVEEDESKEASASEDELSSSVHIPRGVLSRYIRK